MVMGRFNSLTRCPLTVVSHPVPLKRGDKAVVLVLALVQLYLHIT